MAFTPLETGRLVIRKWEERDRELFHRINSDAQVMKYFPFRRNREESDKMMDQLNRLIEENGFSFLALELKSTGACIGFCGLHKIELPEVFPHGGTEIGWRLAPEFWGKGYVTEAGFKLLDYGFNVLNLQEIVSFAVHDNTPSLAVMNRLGMTADPARDYEHPAVPDTHPQLKLHRFYAISRSDYLEQVRRQGQK